MIFFAIRSHKSHCEMKILLHISQTDDNNSFFVMVTLLPFTYTSSEILRSPSPCSSILNWQATLGSFGHHGLFIRLAFYETGLPIAFAICDNKLRFIPGLHRRFSADDALPLTCLSIDACCPSHCFVSASIHFETIADPKYIAIDAFLCTPQTFVQLLIQNGL